MITIEMILSQIMFWTIALTSGILAYEFYKTKNGRLRVLMIEFFISKVWVYSFAGAFFLLWDFGYLHGINQVWMRLCCNAPMFIIMLKLLGYVRGRK